MNLLKLLITILILFQSSHLFAQKELRIVNPRKPQKVVVFKKRTHTAVYYTDTTVAHLLTLKGRAKRKKILSCSGRIVSITDSTIAIKEIFRKEPRIVRLDKIYMIKKIANGRIIFSWSILSIGMLVMVIYMNPQIPPLIILPPVLIYDLIFPQPKLRYPLKYNVIDPS